MDSFLSSTPTDIHQQQRRKKRKIQHQQSSSSNPLPLHLHQRWRTHTAQRIYSSKLLRAIRHLPPKRPKQIRRTADTLLAISAKGLTRWSRAILPSPNSNKQRHRKLNRSTAARARRFRTKLPVLQRKFRLLGRLIPGCRKVSRLNLLEEATDYITALEMQVRAMTALTEILAVTQSVHDRLCSNS